MEGMNQDAQGTGAEAGDPVETLLGSLRTGIPSGFAEMLGDQAFLLTALATEPGPLFSAAAHSSTHYAKVLTRLQEHRAAMDALEMRCIVALADATRREDRAQAETTAAHESDALEPQKATDERAERSAAREVSMSTRRSPDLASRTLAAARRLVESMPVLLRAVATGHLTESSARSAASSVAPLSPQQREQVDALLGARLATLDGCGSEEWRGAVATAIAETDATGEARRHQHSRRRRSVTVRRAEHGMAVVAAHLPALEAMKIRKRLSLEAERLRASGDRRGHQQIQADSFVDTLLGEEDGMDRTDLDLGVIITDRTLLHPGRGELAQIEGYGTVPFEAVREDFAGSLHGLAHGADEALGADAPAVRLALRRLYTHPRTGELVAVESVGRAFPPALARFIRWRDMTCRGPFCNAPIRHCDHIRSHAAGGPTSLDNGQGLCAFCNDKEQQTASVERDPDSTGHRVTWTSPHGTSRTTGPAALTSPQSDGSGPPVPPPGIDRPARGDPPTRAGSP